MQNQECTNCGMPIDEKTCCTCNPDLCYHCCDCEKDCSCGCEEK